MQLSVFGIVIGCTAGMFAVSLILKVFLPTDIDTDREKWIRRIGCGLVLVLFTFGGGYLLRTQLSAGDYSGKQCDREGCGISPVYKLRYELATAYYCENHVVDAYALTDPALYEMMTVKDTTGHTKEDAWTMAQRIAREELDLPDDADFCDILDARVEVRGAQWTVRGVVTVQGDDDKPGYVYFNTVFHFSGSDYFLVEFSTE